MNITLFTGNQPRHLYFARILSQVCERLFVIQECNTVFPGQVADFYDNSLVMQEYFSKVRHSERKVFGKINFLPSNVYQMAIKDGDLDYIKLKDLGEAINSDLFIVYGSSYIKGELANFLVERKAINIHMGVSPYFRGNSSNFWAMYYRMPELVGATIMKLDYGLDSGPTYYHCFPKPQVCNGFDLGMLAVKAAQDSVIEKITDGSLFEIAPKYIESTPDGIHYYRKRSDFTDEVAAEYLSKMMNPIDIYNNLANRNLAMYFNAVEK